MLTIIRMILKVLRGHKNYGLDLKHTRQEPSDYRFGASPIPDEILNESGQYDKYLPLPEVQRKLNIDTMACTSFGTLNALEINHNCKYGEIINKSDRALAKMSGTNHNGNSVNAPIETLRKKGVPDEHVWPWDEDIKTLAEFYAPLTDYVFKKALEFKDNYLVYHDWVRNDPEQMMEALKYSSLGATVYAWFKYKNTDMYYNPGFRDNHWVVIYGYVKGKYWKVFDSYPPHRKKWKWDSPFMYVKRYYITKKNMKDSTQDFLKKNNHKLVMDVDKTGAVGLIEDGKVRIATNQKEQLEILLSVLIRNGYGNPVHTDLWDDMPKETLH